MHGEFLWHCRVNSPRRMHHSPVPRLDMTNPRDKLGIALGIAGVVLFAGTLPATRFAVATIDPLFLTAAPAAAAACALARHSPGRSVYRCWFSYSDRAGDGERAGRAWRRRPRHRPAR